MKGLRLLAIGIVVSAVSARAVIIRHDVPDEKYRADAKAAKELLGNFSTPKGVDAAEFAAWYGVASAMLNLDETITKN